MGPKTNAGENPASSEAPARRRLNFLPVASATALVLFVVWIVYSFVTDSFVTRADEKAPRNADGVRVGAEALAMGPEEARQAALLVHGFIGGSSNFGALPQRLADAGVYVRAMRLPGHGTSPRDFEKVTADELMLAVEEAVADLNARHDHVTLVGHSMGGALGTLVAARGNVDKLVLAAPYFRVTYYWYYALPVEVWTQVTSPFVRWTYKGDAFVQVNRAEAKDDIFSYRWVPAKGSLTLLEIGRRARDPEALKLVMCPVLWIHGAGDRAASPSAARKAVAQMGSTQKEQLWLEESNHHVFWDYEREEVIAAIVRFIVGSEGSAESVDEE